MLEAVLDKETAGQKPAAREIMDTVLLHSIASAPAPAHGPAWWRDLKRNAWKTYESLPFPQPKDPAWRFGQVNQVNNPAPYHQALPVSDADADRVIEVSLAEAATLEYDGLLVFANDAVMHQHPLPASLSDHGVIFAPFSVALEKHPELLQKYLLRQEATLGGEKFRQLHAAQLTNGTLVYVPRGVKVTKPLQIFHWVSGELSAIFPHTLVIAEELAEVTVADFYLSAHSGQTTFSIGVNDLVAGRGAKVDYVSSQRFGSKVVSVQLGGTTAERDAHVKGLGVHLGGQYSRTENKSRLIGAGSRSDMLALTVSQDKEVYDQRTYQDHLAPHTTSDLLYKNALADESQTIFAGLIRVEREGQQTNAYQSNRNLLLDPTAEANSLPGLEILADDVRCTHGSTTGQVDDEQMFYLAQRGIPTSVGQRLLVFGFFQEVLQRFGHEAVTTLFTKQIEAKFGK